MANIWIAAADNDLARVQHLLESGQFSANAKDPNGYTPVHAAASYGHKELLRYLVQHGGDINVQDAEGDTPLHHVEELDMARLLVAEYGADYKIRNKDGLTPAQYLEQEDESPEVVQYLRSLAHDNVGDNILDTLPQPGDVAQHISYRYQAAGDGGVQIEIDDAKRETLRDIVQSDNPEARLEQFLKDQVHEQFRGEHAGEPNKRRK